MGRPNQQHGRTAQAHHLLRDAAEQHVPQAAVAVRAQDDQVRVQLLGVQTSSILLRMLPYLFTLAVLFVITVVQRQARVPGALTLPYFREE